MNSRFAPPVLLRFFVFFAAAVPLLASTSGAVRAQPRGPAGPVAVEVGRVQEVPIGDSVRAVGNIAARRESSLSFSVSGQIERLLVEEGDRVAEGQALAALDPTYRVIAVAEAEASLAGARAVLRKLEAGYLKTEIAEETARLEERKAALAKADADLERVKDLRAKGVMSSLELDAAVASQRAAAARVKETEAALAIKTDGFRAEDVEAQSAQVARLGAALDRAREDLKNAELAAPFGGVVSRRERDVGEWTEVGDSVVTILDLDDVDVETFVIEADVGRVKPGLDALVTVDAHPGEIFRGLVRTVVPEADRRSRTFAVKIAIDNRAANLKLKAGMSARAEILVGEKEPVIVVSRDAVLKGPEGEYVFLVREGRARRVAVETGRSVGGLVELKKGALAPGDPVVVTGNETLKDDAEVRSTERS